MPKSALILVEFQNEWLAPEGKLTALFEDPELLKTTLTHASEALAHARNIAMPVIYTAMGFSDNYCELGQTEFGLRGAIPPANTWQDTAAQIHHDFTPHTNEYVVANKKGGSAFAHTDLDFYLRNHDIKRLYFVGFALHVCILASAWAAHDLGYEVVILEDAVAAFNQSQQDFVLKELIHHCGKQQTVQQFKESLLVTP